MIDSSGLIALLSWNLGGFELLSSFNRNLNDFWADWTALAFSWAITAFCGRFSCTSLLTLLEAARLTAHLKDFLSCVFMTFGFTQALAYLPFTQYKSIDANTLLLFP